MRKTITGAALLLALVFCLTGCSPPKTETPSATEGGTPQPSVNASMPSAQGNSSEPSINSASLYMLPNWNTDFIPHGIDRFIPLERFAHYLKEAGSPFRLISEQPVEFEGDNFIIYLEPADEFNLAANWIKARNFDGSNERDISVASHLEQVNGEPMIALELAQFLWDCLDIANSFDDIDSYCANVGTHRVNRSNERVLAHQESQAKYSNLPKSSMEPGDFPMTWFSQADTRVSLSEFSAAIEAKNSNFTPHGMGIGWDNGHITVTVSQKEGSWGIVISDETTGVVMETYDDTGWYKAYPDNFNSLSGKLAVSLWGTLAVCDSFTTMEPVLMEVAAYDTFNTFLKMRYLYPNS